MSATTDVRIKFELGRHETFALREGWLAKGLDRLVGNGTFTSDAETADALGLGSRMAKSLQFWLEATNLAERQGKAGLRASPLGLAVIRLDPYFEFPITWWFVHLALVRRNGSIWNWFFNDFRDRSFERSACIDAFSGYIRDVATNRANEASIQREVGCLLHSYVAPSADQPINPEDATACPLRNLGLLLRQSGSGRLERTKPLDVAPVEAFLACAALLREEIGGDIPVIDLLRRRNSPGRVLGMDGDAIEDACQASALIHGDKGVSLTRHGSDRVLAVPGLAPEQWLAIHFERAVAK